MFRKIMFFTKLFQISLTCIFSLKSDCAWPFRHCTGMNPAYYPLKNNVYIAKENLRKWKHKMYRFVSVNRNKLGQLLSTPVHNTCKKTFLLALAIFCTNLKYLNCNERIDFSSLPPMKKWVGFIQKSFKSYLRIVLPFRKVFIGFRYI